MSAGGTLIRLLITPRRVDATDAGQRVSPAGNLSPDICNMGRLLLLVTPNNKDTVCHHLLPVTRDLQTELVPTNHFKLQKYLIFTGMMTRSPQEKSIFAVKHGKTSVYKTNIK